MVYTIITRDLIKKVKNLKERERERDSFYRKKVRKSFFLKREEKEFKVKKVLCGKSFSFNLNKIIKFLREFEGKSRVLEKEREIGRERGREKG